MFSRLPVFQRVGPAAYKNTLDNTYRLDDLYGNPHRCFKTVHVAGTNGKGSVSHMLAAVFQSAGYKTGLYTSPHLKDFRERIRINGQMMPKERVVEWVGQFSEKNKSWELKPSFFEITVAMAFHYFAREEVDIAIIETGLGGRLDSTNIITPEVSVITNIGLDHTALLGSSLQIIAREKAGIIKPGVPAVIGETQPETKPVFSEVAIQREAPLFFADQEFFVSYALRDIQGNQLVAVEKNDGTVLSQIKLDLKGFYQQKNLPAVLKTVELMQAEGWKISDKHLREGLGNTTRLTGLTGRWQILSHNPLIVCDTAHNAEGIAAVVDQLKQIPCKQMHIVFGMVNDKSPEEMLKLLPRHAVYYFTKANVPRALGENELKAAASNAGLQGTAFPGAAGAFDAARATAGKDDLIFIGGSTFIVAEIL